MGIIVTLIDQDGRRIRSIPDGLGSVFDAAGGFDRLIDYDSPFPMWQSLDPDGTVLFDSRGARKLLDELPEIAKMAKGHIELLSFDRLRMLADMCANSESLRLKADGD
jgi:hypothetical protein